MDPNEILRGYYSRIKTLVENFDKIKDDRDLATIRKNLDEMRCDE